MAGRRKTLSTLLKIAVSAGLLAWILARQDLAAIVQHLRKAAWPWLAVAFALNGSGLLIRAYRWRILARPHGDDLPVGFLFRSCLIGEFFNNFLPTSVGGDAYRIWDGSRKSKSIVRSSAIVIVERMSGILILFLFALGASLLRLDMVRGLPLIAASLGLGLAGFAALGLFFLPAVGRFLRRPVASRFLGRIMLKAAEFRDVIVAYRNHPRDFLRATAWAFLLQVNVILYYYLIGRALGLAVPLTDYFVFIPLVLIILLLPVSINGLGLREIVYVSIFASYGIASEAALAFSFVGVAFSLLVSVAGGILFATRER